MSVLRRWEQEHREFPASFHHGEKRPVIQEEKEMIYKIPKVEVVMQLESKTQSRPSELSQADDHSPLSHSGSCNTKE